VQSLRLIHITPELPPTIGGIADYTSILSRRLVEVSDGAIQPLLVRAGWKKGEAIDAEFPAKDLAGQCSAKSLANTISKLAGQTENKAVVLLEYSGYGYAKRGAPMWLLRGLQKVCEKDDIPLVTMFHELYANGKPWSSAFWMSPLQRYVAARLAKLSNAVVTNREQSAQWLQKYVSDDKPLHVQPVFSNVGEPESVPPFEEREPYAVVFGGEGMKQRLYSEWEDSIDSFLQEVGIEKIIDIGGTDKTVQKLERFPVETVGIQLASAIGEYMKNAQLGLIDYPLDRLTKSGVFSAYMAYGLNICVRAETGDPAPLKEGVHFMRFQATHPAKFKNLGVKAFEFYQNHVGSFYSAKLFKGILSRESSGVKNSKLMKSNE